MASQVSPGVVIRERDLTNTTIVGSQALRAAFAGAFQKGPVETPTAINNQKELVDTFGGPVDANAEDWFVASEFLSYGGRLVVSRAIDAAATIAESTGSEVAAANEGSWGNDLQLVAVDRGYDQSVTFNGVPDSTANGDVLTFTGGKTAKIYGYNAESAFLVGDKVEVGDLTPGNDGVIGTITNISAGTTIAGEADEIYTAVAVSGGSGSGATVTVTRANDGSVASVVLVSGGEDYEATDAGLVIDGALIGGASTTDDITFDVDTLVAQIDVATAEDWYRNTTLSVGTFTLKLNQIGPRPGTSQQATDLGFSRDEFHIAVVSKSTGAVLETFQYLSKLQGGKGASGANTYFRTLVNEQSENVVLADGAFDIVTSSGIDWTAALTDSVEEVSAAPDELALLGTASFSLTGGSDAGYAYGNTALEVFRSYDATDLDFILMGGSGAAQSDTLAKATTAISIAQERKDCIAFVSPHKGNQLDSNDQPLSATAARDNTLDFFSGLASSSYAVFDSGYKYLYDRFNDVYRYIPCNGDVAGLCVSTSAALADWYSPAGLSRGSLQNAIKLAYNPTQADRDDLYSERINPIISLRGSGITLFGDKTALSSPSAFDRINVRRLFLNVERRVDALAQGVLFEQNDAISRSGFASAVSSYLAEIRADRGVTDFLVVCDESNNTPSVIDRNEFVADIYLQPTRSINFITVTLTATRTGVSFSEVTGQ